MLAAFFILDDPIFNGLAISLIGKRQVRQVGERTAASPLPTDRATGTAMGTG